jgi:hypothetical protein
MTGHEDRIAARGTRGARLRGRTSTRSLAMVLLGGLAVGNADCAQERDPISQLQPGRLEKRFFVGQDLRSQQDNPEFYINNYIVASSGSNNLMPVGTYDDTDRIIWEVQENVLLARKSYEHVTGQDGARAVGQRVYQGGLVVAAYRIQSHFDVRRMYNPTTGEESNIVTENMSDRPWFQREYMRVDWSQNLVDNPDWGMRWFGTLFGGLSFQPVAYYEQDPTSPNAPNLCEMTAGQVRDPQTGECRRPRDANGNEIQARNHPGGYFDVTSKWLVSPAMNTQFGFPLPTCLIVNLFTGSEVYDCNPQETTVRTAFRRVEDRDFQPLEMTRAPYDLVGGPRATRNGYDEGQGTLDQNFRRYAMIHNIWQRSHLQRAGDNLTETQRFVACTNDADANSDGTADACQSPAGFSPDQWTGSRCDVVMNKCTIPYRNREVRPITYYITGEMPRDFMDHVATVATDGNTTYRAPTAAEIAVGPGRPNGYTQGATEEIIDSWDLAVRRAIASAREVECRRIGTGTFGGDRAACHAKFFETGTAANIPQGDGVFLGPNPRATPMGAPATSRAVVTCHNPVRADDSTACREVGYSTRYGDLRYVHVSYWGGFTRAPFGGIAHWSYDPLTGEVVGNGALTMGRSVEHAAAQQRDFIRLVLNSIDPNLDPLDVNAFIGGGPTASLTAALRNPQALRNLGSGTAGEMTPDQLRERLASHDHERVAQNIPFNVQDMGQNHGQIAQAMQAVEQDSVPVTGPSAADLAFRNLASRLHNTPYESQMLDRSWLQAAGVNPESALTQAVVDRVSPLRNFDPRFTAMIRESIVRRGGEHGVCFQDAAAGPMVGSMNLQGVARYYARRYPAGSMTPEVRARRILADLRIEAYKGIQLHEVGHAIGLYHQFASSYDSVNFAPQYWQLRTRSGTAAGSCRDEMNRSTRNPNENQDNCMGPRWIDPYSSDEMGMRPVEAEHHHAGIDFFGNTSTMEYSWERFGETLGLGSYDFQAMGLLYGRVVETMDRNQMPVTEQMRFSPRLRAQNTEKDYIGWFDPQLIPPAQQDQYRAMFGLPTMQAHYTELGRQLQTFDMNRCRPATAAELARYRYKLVDGLICSHVPHDVAAFDDMETSPYLNSPEDDVNPDLNAHYWRVRAGTRDGGAVLGDNEGPVRWHYRVAWDRAVGYPNVFPGDQGADIYEVTRGSMLKYDLMYPAQYFRRGRREWNSWSIGPAVSQGMFRFVRGYHWNVARDISFFRSVTNDATFAQYASDDNVLAGSIAIQPVMFDYFSSVLLRPEPGDFILSTRTSNSEADRTTPESRRGGVSIFDATERGGSGLFRLGIVDGRYIGNEVDTRAGGSWDYNSYVVREGADGEKPFAAIMLTDTRPTFSSITRNLYLDGREFQVNFFTDMPQAFDRLLGGIMAEDWPTIAMHATTAPDPAGGLPIGTPRPLALWSDRPTRPAGSSVLFPNVGYRLQVPTAIFAMLFSSLNSELTTINKFRIWTVGGGEQVDVPENEQIRFINPETGVTYAARRYGVDANLSGLTSANPMNQRQIDRGIASRMIAHANELLAGAFRVQSTNADGTHVMARDSAGALIPVDANLQVRARAITAYRNYVGLVDAVRNISNILGYGLLR